MARSPDSGARKDARLWPYVGRATQKNRCQARNRHQYISHFCYNPDMTIGIIGPERKTPGRNAVVGLIVTAIFAVICLVLLALVGDFLVDWMWFSAIGYWQVF